ncbi:hypothetical protein JQ557_19105 [Bradyrhizobium sp. U87765 SZCCT0131]|uniref:hypothetical protein n=1 Tax=unclassified Bradyrhizobium TaxID=2631580 RepID=UPI001BAA078D|nr:MULTISPECIES: hypothetical protein [unclassified Bradyrhizobium]MBR1220122.1 hypothetical protein [Bradyrhizobium sp. U87765 SZCCT0131]MBR1263422.1 hypothetical protein [Bradyrhizobium sp. U87765 SZCCT0134]MBR1308991.1 hypothetical protein [Bradyrhizobium sp. U87765 SZCCT0110]MBR1323754.1 hypothetical protein [Bradyrhizobium sp. U87765 SZCCT0109]MBR1349306.1 hypothetical protein [Bradyrhizobium sp. U87765 SZCCT0048]
MVRSLHRRQSIRLFVATVLAMAALLPARAEDCGFKTPPDIDIGRELMITDLSVVNDARASGSTGAWSFGTLITRLAAGRQAGAAVKAWLATWDSAGVVNGFALPARAAVHARLVAPWMAMDGATSFASWTPDLAHAPFRLLAIVYRPDLGIVSRDGAIANAGEARLVFTALDLAEVADPDRAPPLPFTLIFEYALPATDRDQVKAWAERWHGLGRLPHGEAYNAALQAITDAFDGRAAPATVRLRTNDGLSQPWQLREYHRAPDSGLLVNAPVSNTPHLSLTAAPDALSAFVNDNRGHDLPGGFLGGNADIPDPAFRWPAMAIANNVLRHNFAMLTCNGCHAAETGRKADETDPAHAGFRHIGGRMKQEQATLSEFLTGNPATVPDPTGKLQTFCDLKMRQKAMFEALNPLPASAAAAPHPDDLSVARSRRDRTD